MKDKVLEESSDSDNGTNGKIKAVKSPPRRLKSVDITDYKVFEEEKRTTQLVYSYKGGKRVPKLREPRNLFAFNEEKGLQPPRWPSEMRVISTRPRFIDYAPKNPEPFWKQDKVDVGITLRKTADEAGELVYDNPQPADKYFTKSKVGGRTVSSDPFYKLQSPEDDTLLFESKFESGNLKRAIKVGKYEYLLWMKTDLYTIKHTQWFFFRIRNTQPGVTYQFTIINFIKSNSLYNDGMQPLFYSEMDAYKNKIGWVRKGENVKYYKNEMRREHTTKDRYHYSLTWTFQSKYDKDTCYFAHCYPYTYSDLQEYLIGIRNDPVKTRLCKQRVLCRTLAGNFVYILTITNPSRRPADAESKKAVIITARVHPGETNSSWMMKGLLDFLTSNNPDAKLLRDTFIFKIIPMINPDGVIIGNYRCSLTGRDLNRNYKTVLKDSFPPIWHVRTMTKKLLEERDIVLYCDLHGHSRKQNVFIYGCDNKHNPLRRLRERIFPMMMSKNAPCKFSFKGCKFKVQKSKEGTGRVVMWNLGIMNSFTMEATFCGSSLGKRNGFHFSTVDLEAMGYHLCDTLLDYCDPDSTKYVTILRELEEMFKAEMLEKMIKKGMAAPNMTTSDIDMDANYTSDMESSTGGSDSSVSDGLPMHLIYAPHAIQYNQNPKMKKLRSRKERNKRRAKAMKIKDVLLTDVPKPEPEPEAKMSYKKQPSNSPARPKGEQQQPKAEQGTPHGSSSPIRLCREHSLHNKGVEYLEAVTNTYMLSGVLVSEVKTEVPHFRYTAGSNYLNEVHSVSRNESISRWSTHSAEAHPQEEEEEGNFTVSFLAKQLEKNKECTVPRCKSDGRVASAALELARKITTCNSRYKTESSPQVVPENDIPILRPASPGQLWNSNTLWNPSWKPRGKFLSSTKALLHQQPRQNLSNTDLRNSSDNLRPVVKATKSLLMSTSGTWSENDYIPEVAKIRPRKSDEKQVLHRGRP
ncbi:cytosolic carboxypeptidase 2-like, partial [Actinia tenebrosa]|uniref:Cytosolic carboxypeptidase 2-like n=1 Tax=Actinia tenebrosa TaxID=6105 RepID=A0A6P8J627_ACTTE